MLFVIDLTLKSRSFNFVNFIHVVLIDKKLILVYVVCQFITLCQILYSKHNGIEEFDKFYKVSLHWLV